MSKQTFLDRLSTLRVSNCDELPTPELAVLARAVASLRRSGFQHHCLQTGETAPDFQFVSRHGEVRSLYELLQTGPVIINFFRGFWCMFCRTELEALNQITPELERYGAHYLAISPQKEILELPQEVNGELIVDQDNGIARTFQIVHELGSDERALFSSWGLDLGELNNSEAWALPIPATYLIARDRTIAFQFADVDFRTRCCPDDLLEELARL